MTPALKASRGAKRRCQNESCALPFYDLNRNPIVCPNCSTAFVPPPPEPSGESRGRYARSAERRFPAQAPIAPEPVEAAEELVEEPLAAEPADGDTILEVEEEEDEAIPLPVEEEPGNEE